MQDLAESLKKLWNYAAHHSFSYYVYEYIIYKYTKNKVRLLNETAVLFHENKKQTMVIPFLMKANELDEGDIDTLFNISRVLVDWKEYDMALEYVGKIEEKSDKVISLINRIYQGKAGID